MNWVQRLLNLEEQLEGQKIWHNSNYYRLRKIQPDKYELAVLVPGPCGDTAYAPRMTLLLLNKQLTFLTYYNNHETPIQSYTFTEEQSPFFSEEFEKLLQSFETI